MICGRPGAVQWEVTLLSTPLLALIRARQASYCSLYLPLSAGPGGGAGGGPPAPGRLKVTNQMPPQSGRASRAA